MFETHVEAHEAAGLRLQGLWRNADDPEEVFFLFSVEDRARAQAFMDAPHSAEAGQEAGVIDGDYYFVVETAGSRGSATPTS